VEAPLDALQSPVFTLAAKLLADSFVTFVDSDCDCETLAVILVHGDGLSSAGPWERSGSTNSVLSSIFNTYR
jgi:hypothetical protein